MSHDRSQLPRGEYEAHPGSSAGLFKGLVPTLLRAVPAAAVTFGAFELTKGKP